MNTVNARPRGRALRRTVRQRHPLIVGVIAVAAGVALSVTGCTADPESTPASSGSTSQPSATSGEANQPGRISLEDAASKARDLTRDSTVISVESENAGQHWEVKTATSDGTEYVTLVNAGSGSIVRGAEKKNEDAEDVAETRALLDGAKLDYSDAAKLLRKQVSGGTLTELNLDDFNGAIAWEGDVVDASGTKHEIKVDAASGSVVANNTDTPDD